MRPFKFFFAISVGLILFFFLARVLFIALLFAGVMSLIFYAVRGIKNFFRRLDWEDYEYDYAPRGNSNYSDRLPGWKFKDELLVDDWDRPRERFFSERIIQVR